MSTKITDVVRKTPLASLAKLTYHAAMTNPRDIGARIRTAREDLGWTQDQLAAEVGVSRSAVAQWETGRAGQVTTNLTRVAAALGVGVEHLMYGRGKLAPESHTPATNSPSCGCIANVRQRTARSCSALRGGWRSRSCASAPPRRRYHRGDRAGRQPRQQRVRPTGQDDRNPRA